MKLTDEVRKHIQELHDSGLASRKIARQLFEEKGINVSKTTINYYLKYGTTYQRKFGDTKAMPKHVELKINADGTQTSSTPIQMTEEQSKDPDYVLRAHGFDDKKWEIISVNNNYWQQNSQENGLINLYQSKITVRPIGKKFTIDDMVEAINQGVKEVTISNENDGEKSLVISLFDLHFGITKLEMLESHLHQMANIIKNGYKRIEIIVGGDILHSDYVTKSQTSSNTQLDPVKTVRALNEAEQFISTIIELSLKNAPIVEVKAVSGNHDTDSQYFFIWGLSKKYPQIAFDNELNTQRLAFSFGKIGIMVAHGNLALKRLPMLFANEYPDIWSHSTYRMVASGHFHTEKKTDMDGVMMYQFGTAKPNDPYEKANGYTMARKHLQLLEFDDERLRATYEIE